MTSTANLPPVSTTLWWQICHRCKRHRWQRMGTISDFWQLKMNLKEKIYLYTNSATQKCQKEIKKIFQNEDVFHLPLVSTTPVVHLELWISPQFFEKIRNGLGETDPSRKPEVPLNLEEIYNISSCGDSSIYIPFRRTKPAQQEQITGKCCRTEQWTQPAAFIPTHLG